HPRCFSTVPRPTQTSSLPLPDALPIFADLVVDLLAHLTYGQRLTDERGDQAEPLDHVGLREHRHGLLGRELEGRRHAIREAPRRSEEHTSDQSREELLCRPLLEKQEQS